MPSAHWNIRPDLLAWVQAESKRLHRSTSQVVERVLRAAKLGEETMSGPSVARWLETEAYDDTSDEERRTLLAAAQLVRERWET